MGSKMIQFAVVMSAICWTAGVALGGATWLGQPYSVSIPTHVNGVNQAISGSTNMTLQHDVACDIIVSAAGGTEILAAGGRSLTTAYMLAGPDVSNGDGTWVPSATFITKTYHVVGTGPNSTITISVQATPPLNQAPEAGAYSASITLTTTW
ncbi:MAG: hypothetical protein ACHRHE_13575 [Tepidisphaerales bacterium]